MNADIEFESTIAQLLALQVLVTALLRAHPAPDAVLAEVPSLDQATRDMLVATTFRDSMIAKYERELELLSLGLRR